MTLHTLRERPTPELAMALAEFEARFTYPLGPGRSFRISHGDDYPRFYRAIGDATTFVLTSRGDVRGVLAVAVRPLILPDGTTRQAAYVGDIKAFGGRQLVQLARAADAWARPQVTAAYGVVMDGTAAVPTNYTGRVGIQPFTRLAQILVLRFSTLTPGSEVVLTSIVDRAEPLYLTLSAGRFATPGGNPAERSETVPLWLVDAEGHACGRLEDTRRAKRLIADDGVEMRSAHLACFAFRTYRAGAGLIRAALRHAAGRGFPALFVAIAPHDLAGLEAELAGVDKVVAPATIYGAGLEAAAGESAWNVSTSEI